MDKQKPITPIDLLAAARLLKDYCGNMPFGGCKNCIFYNNGANGMYCCILFEPAPHLWQLSDAEHKAAEGGKKYVHCR